tara:strand:- start:125 stop:430 length:306 start_codon:yes stop_codon:yes gene_type:complete
MATISITIPDGYKDTVVAAVRATYQDQTRSIADDDVALSAVVHSLLESVVKHYEQRRIGKIESDKIQVIRDQADTDIAVAKAAKITAEKAAVDAVTATFDL